MQSPPNPASTALFKKFVADAPELWPENTSTHQGLYIMSADGDFLSGSFARQSNENAREIIEQGWEAWNLHNRRPSREVPQDELPLFGGELPQPGGLKLRVAYRDLPRGDNQRPGDAMFDNPHNIGWVDLTGDEAGTFLPQNGLESTSVPIEVVRNLALTKLKDSVRGQMDGWGPDDWRGGELTVQQISSAGSVTRYRIAGSANMEQDGTGLAYYATLDGHFSFDKSAGEFEDFQLIAVGQRSGAGPFNGREGDLGPAPMGVVFRMFK